MTTTVIDGGSFCEDLREEAIQIAKEMIVEDIQLKKLPLGDSALLVTRNREHVRMPLAIIIIDD